MAARAASKLKLSLGLCLPSFKTNASKIRIKTLELDENLMMYFPKYKIVFAHDPQQLCKTGDTVLVQNLPKKLTRLISHKVLEVVYPLGDVTDPVTGKKVVVGKYRDEIKRENEMYGELETAFDYDKAPPRGSQEDKRDFSHKPSYIKFHEDPDDPQPYSV